MRKIILFLLLLAQVGFSQDFYVMIRVENVTDLIGMSMYINYDPSIVEVPDIDNSLPGTQVGTEDLEFLPNSTLLVSIKKDADEVEEPGTLIVGYTAVPPATISGDGDCFTIKFRTLAGGDSGIQFVLDKSSIQDINGEMEAEWYVNDVDRTNDVARVILEVKDATPVDPDPIPLTFALEQNYPNPFNPTTVIEYTMESKEHVVISVYDVLGKEIVTLVNDIKPMGRYKVYFNGENLATGQYYYYMSVGNRLVDTRKMTILK